MIFAGASEVDLLLALQDAALGGAEWRGFLAQLAGMTEAGFAALVIAAPDPNAPKTILTATPRGHDARADPMALIAVLSDAMRPERIYATQDLVDLGGHAAPATMLDALGMASVRAIRIATADTGPAFLGLFATTPFDAADGAVLRRLYPHLQATLRAAGRIARERSRAAIAATLAHETSLAWFLLDRTGLVVETSARSAPGLTLVAGPQGDRLALSDRAAQTDLLAALEAIAMESAPRSRAIRLSHDPARHIRVSPWAGPANPWTRPPIALAALRGELKVATDAADLLVDLFRLLPSEARLATALAAGDTLTDAAERLGLTIETARNYSKKIYAKTATAGQADLIRLIYATGLAYSQ